MNGIGALSYLIDRWNFFFSRIGKIPVGVGFLALPLPVLFAASARRIVSSIGFTGIK